MADGDQTPTPVTSQGDTSNNLSQPLVTNNAPNLQAELETMTADRDDLRRQLSDVQRQLAALTDASPTADTISKLQQDNDHLRKTLRKATDMLREKINTINAHEKRNSAMGQQVTSLKEVLQVTRDLLNIRNMEVEQLQKNVDTMESRIEENRRRQSAMIKQMELATNINGQLRNEYETQLKIFQSLKQRYEEKVDKLTKMANERDPNDENKAETVENTIPKEVPEEGTEIESKTPTEADNATVTVETTELGNELPGQNPVIEGSLIPTQPSQVSEAREPAEITS